MKNAPISTWFFVATIVRQGDKFLLIREQKHNQTWYLPAGRVDAGEDLFSAAIRETQEEAGIPIEIDGVLRVEHTPTTASSPMRVRVILVGRPVDDTEPKQVADEHSLEAGWFTYDELLALPLRGTEVPRVIKFVLDGGFVAPRSMITPEDVGWPHT